MHAGYERERVVRGCLRSGENVADEPEEKGREKIGGKHHHRGNW